MFNEEYLSTERRTATVEAESVSTIVTRISGSSLASSKPIRISIYPKMNFVLLMHELTLSRTLAGHDKATVLSALKTYY